MSLEYVTDIAEGMINRRLLAGAPVRRRWRRDGAGSKHISHILEEAPERAEIYERTFAQQCAELWRAYWPAFRLRSAPASFRDSANLFPPRPNTEGRGEGG